MAASSRKCELQEALVREHIREAGRAADRGDIKTWALATAQAALQAVEIDGDEADQ